MYSNKMPSNFTPLTCEEIEYDGSGHSLTNREISLIVFGAACLTGVIVGAALCGTGAITLQGGEGHGAAYNAVCGGMVGFMFGAATGATVGLGHEAVLAIKYDKP